jgi:hypothetical protein
MMDLHEHLAQIAGPAEPPTAAQIEADLVRGRRALRRRRTTQTIAGSVLGAAALVTAFSLTTNGVPAGSRPPVVADRPAAGASNKVTLRLVAYKGAQAEGFTVDTVPEGYFIQTNDKSSLLLAPNRAKNPGPNVDPSKAPVYDPQMFVDKIGVFLQSRDYRGPSGGKPVKVGDHNGVLVKSKMGMTPEGPIPPPADGDTGWQIFVGQPRGVYLVVQFWSGLGLSKDQMIEIAAGVHVHADALRAVG